MQHQQTALSVPEDLITGLQRVADHTGRSSAAILREAVESYLRDIERPVVDSLGAGDDPQLNARDVREWLDRNYDPR